MSGVAEKFARLTPVPAYQMVAEAIEREILSGRLRPGDPIGTEAQLLSESIATQKVPARTSSVP